VSQAEDEDADISGAERAFERLRAEVAALRQLVEGQTTPDYALTLGAIAKELQSVTARLAAIETHPALAMTPEAYSAELSVAAESGRQAMERALRDAQFQLAHSVHRVEEVAGRVNTREDQQRRIERAVACGVILGIALWYIVPPMLPVGAGDWLISSLVGGGRWRAGETLMQRVSPVSFDRMVRLYKACGERPIETCEAALGPRTAEPSAMPSQHNGP
jgi:hypothetical protein